MIWAVIVAFGHVVFVAPNPYPSLAACLPPALANHAFCIPMARKPHVGLRMLPVVSV